jgi:hypothetical protein
MNQIIDTQLLELDDHGTQVGPKNQKYPVRHKVHINLEYHSVCPLVGIGTPTPKLACE